MEVTFASETVRCEYERWLKQFEDEDLYDGADTVGLHDVLRCHFLIADYFYCQESGLGGVGPRDPNLLHSAVYRQFVSYGGLEKWADPFQKGATLVFGLVTDHPFHDANKRTGLLAMLYALHKHNRVPTVPQRELDDFMVKIAEGSLGRYRRQKALARKDHDADVLFIADYMRRNSRPRDNRFYELTYHELDARLRRFGHCLCNPRNNYIDVARIDKIRGLLGFGREFEKLVKVAQIGFPGWKRVVGKRAIATVRRTTGLTPDKGVDSASFYRGADPVNVLIDQYSGPLRRLAFR